jgi:prevent-host-death family protein
MAVTLTAFEAKTRFGELLERVAQGEEVIITRQGKPVARIVPEGTPRLDQVRRTVAGLDALRESIRKRSRTGLCEGEVRAAIEDGRL